MCSPSSSATPASQQASRWTGCGAPGPASDLGAGFGAAVPVSEVRLYTWDNTGQGGHVAAPASYRVQYLSPGGWADVPDARRSPATPAANGLNLVTFPALTTSQIRVVVTDQPGKCTA
jgi:hypothetical protein